MQRTLSLRDLLLHLGVAPQGISPLSQLFILLPASSSTEDVPQTRTENECDSCLHVGHLLPPVSQLSASALCPPIANSNEFINTYPHPFHLVRLFYMLVACTRTQLHQ